jgi:hypothetical protein
MPVILATLEAEIGRITIQDQYEQGVCKISSQPIAICSGVSLSSQAMQEAEIRRIVVQGQQGKMFVVCN